MRASYFAVLVLLAVGSCGCAKPKVDPYPQQFNATMQAYEAEAVRMAAEPEPDLRNMTRAQRRAEVIKVIERDAAMHERFAARLRALKPSDDFEAVHAAALEVFEIPAREGKKWAEEVREGKRSTGRGTEITKAQISAMGRMVGAIEKAAGKRPELQAGLSNLRKMQKNLEAGLAP